MKSLKALVKRSPYLTSYLIPIQRRLSFFIAELRDFVNVYWAKSGKVITTPYGFKIVGSSSVHHHAMQTGNFETDEVMLIQSLLPDIQLFVDIGANIGFYTCLVRQAGNPVIAIEPLRSNLDYLYKNLAINNYLDVEVYPMGLADNPGLVTLYGVSSTGASLIDGWAGQSAIFHRTIPTTTLDILLGNRFQGQKTLIKLDVEGVEFMVLEGSRNLLQIKPNPVWIVEICLTEYYPNGLNPFFANTFELFWRNNYCAYTANASKTLVTPKDIQRWIEQKYCDSGVINYLFVPKAEI